MNIAKMERDRATIIARMVGLSDAIEAEIGQGDHLFGANFEAAALLNEMRNLQHSLAVTADQLMSVDFTKVPERKQ
jgi:hypothetical protein